MRVSALFLWTYPFTIKAPKLVRLSYPNRAVQLVHFSFAEGGLTKFPVQIRLGYLSFLILSMPESVQWLLWVSAMGTLARVLFGYCIMARMLMLLPFSREISLSRKFIKEAFLKAPVRGNILHGLPAFKTAA